jgi:hypothetical protein
LGQPLDLLLLRPGLPILILDRLPHELQLLPQLDLRSRMRSDVARSVLPERAEVLVERTERLLGLRPVGLEPARQSGDSRLVRRVAVAALPRLPLERGTELDNLKLQQVLRRLAIGNLLRQQRRVLPHAVQPVLERLHARVQVLTGGLKLSAQQRQLGAGGSAGLHEPGDVVLQVRPCPGRVGSHQVHLLDQHVAQRRESAPQPVDLIREKLK